MRQPNRGDPGTGRQVAPGACAPASLQTFGANFHPHVHALVSDGAFTPDGAFLPLPTVDPPVVEELFRRLVDLLIEHWSDIPPSSATGWA